MVEVSFLLPTHDNEGLNLEAQHETLRRFLASLHGVTWSPATGAAGSWGEEEHVEYRVAVPMGKLEGLLRYIDGLRSSRNFKQDAVYVRISGGAGVLEG